ncbi:interferon lambda receptor 1 isoform X2 [Cololabis saira]|uniref:interferon lambda receptor 1 isoform X2 n=1 Tax=Cololabis saira TaxID=129043 RepID=UPI002AD3BC4F|nr:interferon lambda receptor 1 isoform X2 [Cololabis saira]
MWSVNILSLLLFCYACLSIGNGEVYFASRNFYNILKWDPVKPDFPGENVLYSVQYFRAKVCVKGSSIGFTTSFKPLRDTVLGPPILSTNTSVATLHINVTLPQGPNGVSVADIITHSKKGVIKTTTMYILYITSPQLVAQEAESTTGAFDISLKYKHTEYCGYVLYKPNSEPGHSGSENASFCVTLPEDHQRDSRWPFATVVAVAVTVAVLAAIVIILILCMYKYVKGGKTKNLQQTLVITPGTCKVLQTPDRNLILSELQFCTAQSEKTIYATIQVKPNVPSRESGDYSPQEIPCQVWQSNTDSSLGTGAHSTSPNARDTSAQSSEIYSAVVVHVPPEETEDVQQAATRNIETSHSSLSSNGEKSWDTGGTIPKLTSHGAPSFAGSDDNASSLANQLVLNTVRNINGQLMLSSLAFQLQSTAADETLTLNPERKPLLSDLVCCQDEPSLASFISVDSSEWQDSGCEDSTANTPTNPYCNAHYFPSQQVVGDVHQECQTEPSCNTKFESSYKQNWVPEILHDTTPTDTWTISKMDEVGEEDEGTEGMENLAKTLLGHWKVNIQE